MTAMPPDSPAHADPHTRNNWLTAAIWAAVLFAVADAAGGFWLSFTNLSAAGAAHGWHPAWMLAVMIDLGIPTYVIADHVLVALGYRSLLPRLAAWSFAAATVILNGAVSSDPQPLWRAAHMLAPAAWIVGIEALRVLWRALRKGRRSESNRPPVTEWAGAFGRTFGMWRRKLALGVTRWPDMRRLEEARLLVADLAAARDDTGQAVPAAVARTVRTGWLPADLAEAVTTERATVWEPRVTNWAAKQMALSKTLLAAITNASPAPAQDPAATPSRTPAATPRPAARRAPVRRVPQLAGRDLTPAALADLAREKHPGEVLSVNALVRLAAGNGTPVGRPKAQDAHAILAAGMPSLYPARSAGR